MLRQFMHNEKSSEKLQDAVNPFLFRDIKRKKEKAEYIAAEEAKRQIFII